MSIADDSASIDDAGLVTQALAGDAEALSQLLAPLLPRALVLARRLTSSRAAAEDLVQDACLRAIEQLSHFTIGRPFAPWFMRVLVNTGHNHLKAARIREVEELDDQLVASPLDPGRDLESGEIRERFRAAVEALPPRQRLIVYMFDVDGFSGAEIAEALGIAADTVRWHLHAARATLRVALADLRPSPGS